MNRTTVFSKTGKGLLEIKNRSNRLSKDQFRVLNLVDGKATLDDLVDKSRITEVELRKVLTALSDSGFIKEFTNPAGNAEYASVTIPPVPPTAYVDDLDFTQILGPATKPNKPGFYQSAATEHRQREETERKLAEAAATKAREESDKRAKIEAERRAKEEEQARRVREEAERKGKQEQARREKLEAEMKARLDEPRRLKEEAERKVREKVEAEARAKAEADRRIKEEVERRAKIQAEAERKVKEENERRAKIQAEALARVESERKRLQEEERKRQEEEERKRKQEEERKRKEEEERVRREAEERKRKEEEERKRKEEEERKRKEEEERKRKEEEERVRREAEERKRKEEEERRRKEEEERKRKEEEERKRKEEEERKRKEEEERRRKEEEERKRREEEERKRKEEEERKRREEEERKRKEEEERRRLEEEERLRREEEERRRKEEEERKRLEEEERKRKEEEERRRREEEERLRRELEERHRREEEQLRRRMEEERRKLDSGELLREKEEERLAREEEERQARENEQREARENEERERREQEDRRRREEQERAERDEAERRRREREEEAQRVLEREAEQKRREEQKRKEQETALDDLPSLDMVELSKPGVSAAFDSDLAALRRAEAEVEQEFLAKEEAIRKALEEQERRFRMEEEARTALDRAEREAREKSDQEARELAESAERARRDAEQRAREEAVRRQQDEKERRGKEQEERKKRSEEERKKRERDRREAEQRARDEALAKQRAEQDDFDRKKSDRERLAREARKRSWGPGRIAIVAVVVLIGLLIGGIQVAPLSAYAPQMEKMASDAIGEPVRIGRVHASVFPGFHIKMENVTVGAQQDVRVPTLIAYMEIGSLFGGPKKIKTLQIHSLQATQEVLPRLSGWLTGEAAKHSNLKIQRIVFKGAKLEVKGNALPPFDSTLYLAPDGGIMRVTIDSTDGRFSADIAPKEPESELSVHLKNFTLPVGPALEFTDGSMKGTLTGTQIRITDADLTLYGGQVTGQAVIGWDQAWSMEGEFETKRVNLESGMKALKIDIASSGSLDTKVRYSMQANSFETLFNAPKIDSTFLVQKGDLSGIDFVRALQSPSRDGVQGGKTKFDDLSGNLAVNGSRYTFTNVRLIAGLLSASGAGEVLPSREINGRSYVELRSPSNVVKGSFKVTGDSKGIILKP